MADFQPRSARGGWPGRLVRPALLALLSLAAAGTGAARQQESAGPMSSLRQAARHLESGRTSDAAELIRLAAQDLQKSGEAAGSRVLADELLRLVRDLKGLETVDRDALRPFQERLLSLIRRVQDPAPAFSRSYTPLVVLDRPAAGGHGANTGHVPSGPRGADDLGRLPRLVPHFQIVPVLDGKTFCGAPSKDHLLESGGAGVALLDYDGDGRTDIFLVNAPELNENRELVPHSHLLYRNLGGLRFQEVSQAAGIGPGSWGYGVCAGDYDDDGRLDLYVTNFGPNQLLRNNGDGTFAEAAARAGVDHPGWGTGCTFFDADRDGDLDLFVANYVETSLSELRQAVRTHLWRGGPLVMAGPVGLPASPNVFFRNQGAGVFREESSLFPSPPSYSLGVLSTDVDADGWVDLYVANDTQPNQLWMNRGGRFVESGLGAGASLSGDGRAQAGMGVDGSDLDEDGDIDLLVTNFAFDYNTLYRNLGQGIFEDVSRAWGLESRTYHRLGWGAAFLDADLDGDSDLAIANGHLYPQVEEHPELGESYRQANQLLLQEGGQFLDAGAAAGTAFGEEKSSRGLAAGDLDNDGRPDLVISNLDDSPSLLHNRTESDHHWISLVFQKPAGRNRFCIGGRVTVRAGGRRQIREIRSGGSYLSQPELRLHFGLGSFPGPVEVRLELPGEQPREWKGVGVDQVVSFTVR